NCGQWANCSGLVGNGLVSASEGIGMRPSSWPVRLVTNTLSNGKFLGKPQLFTFSAMPQRRQNSTVRMPGANIFASTIVPSPRAMSGHGTPRQPSSTASARPTGPPPTMSTDGSAVDTARGRSGEMQRRAVQILGALDLDQDAVSFLIRIAVLLGLDQATPYFLVHRARFVDLRC